MASKFQIDDVWNALTALLKAKLASTINVANVGIKDLSDEGDLVLLPPCVRVLFQGDNATAMETQKLNYDVSAIFAVMCSAEDLRNREASRQKTIQLVDQVKEVLAGARLLLADGSKTEPVRYLQTDPMPDDLVGLVYIPIFAVPGIAQFSGANA